MDSVPIVLDKEFIHFRKINIFGYAGVGKSSFISLLENYENENFLIKIDIENSVNDSIIISNNLVEQVKRVKIPINAQRDIYLLLYETNLNNFDTIKTNLDTLLLQTECIIIMWDNSHINSFDKIPEFVKMINSLITDREVEIFIVQNKTDLEFDISKEGKSENEIEEKIVELKNKYKNITDIKTSFIKRDDMYKLLLEIERNFNQRKLEENDVVNSVKIKYPFKAIENIENTKTMDLCLLGNSKSGKSTFLKELIGENEYNNDFINLEQNYMVKISDEKIMIKISDTYKNIIDQINFDLYKKCHAFLLFLDVTEKDDDFKYLKKCISIIKEKTKGYLFVIANKIDEKEKRQINKAKAKSIVIENKYKYYECSSLYGINVMEIFNQLLLDAYQKFHEFNLSRVDSFSLKKEEQAIDENGNIIPIHKKSKCC